MGRWFSFRPWSLAVLAAVALVSGAGLSASASESVPRLARSSMPAACGDDGQRCFEQFALPDGSQFPVYRNMPLSGNPTVTHAVVVVHGILRNSKTYFAAMMQAATKDHADADTIVVAPWFQTSQDKPGPNAPYWVDQPPRRADAPGWLQGDGAVRPAGLSSFAVVDDLLDTLADPQRFPNLRSITVAGHSAGGQFVQRYAVFGAASGRLPRVAINYVAANASSYVYFDPTRPVGDGTRFEVPTSAGCPGYDTYKYGLAGRTGYVAALSPQQALAQYLSRRVTIVNGADDTFDNGDEDTTCPAVAQGQHRAARGASYLTYIQGLHPTAQHDRIVVPDVGHSQSDIFNSPLVAPVLFGH